MKFLFLLLLTLAGVFAVPVEETNAAEKLKISVIQGEQLLKQGFVVQEGPEKEEELGEGQKMEEGQGEPGMEEGFSEERKLRPIIGEYESLKRLAEREELPERRTAVVPTGVEQWAGLMRSDEMGEEAPRTRTKQSRTHRGVFAVPVEETNAAEKLKISVIQGEQLLKQGFVVQEGPEMEEELGEGQKMEEGQGEPGMEEGFSEERKLRPIIGEYESLKRLAEREELPERRTAVVPTGAEQWAGLMRSDEMGEEAPRTRTKLSRTHRGWPVCDGIIIEGICYQFFRGPKRAADSEFFCQDNFWNGHLASVTSRYIHKQMMRLMTQDGQGYTRTWVGGLRYLETGRFIWLDGARWSYEDWLLGEPNNTADVEDCVELLSNGKFNDMPCWDLRAFICSFPM